MSAKSLLLSIRPKYAALILSGSKTIELRRVRPSISEGDLIFVYTSSPVKAIQGILRVKKIEGLKIEDLWKEVKNNAGVTREEFDAYFEGKEVGYGIWVKRVESYSPAIALETIREQWSGFRPPQSYMYLSTERTEFLNSRRQQPVLSTSLL